MINFILGIYTVKIFLKMFLVIKMYLAQSSALNDSALVQKFDVMSLTITC